MVVAKVFPIYIVDGINIKDKLIFYEFLENKIA